MAEAHNGDVRIYYELQGEGSPVVLIMGLGGSGRAWGLQVPAFTRNHRVLLPDNRGVGRSDMPPGPYSMHDFAADLRAVLDAAGLPAAHLVGISMGGLIAQEFYHLHPERVTSLTLVATGVGPADPAYVAPEPDVWELLGLDRTTTPERSLAERVVEHFYHSDFRAAVPDLADRLIAFQESEPQPPHAYHAQLAAVHRHTLNSPRLGRIAVPTLVLHGEDDRIWPPANGAYLAQHIPDARLEWLPRTGHMVPMERSREFNERVLRFLDTVEAAMEDPS